MQPELLAACSAQNNKAMSASTHGNEKLHGDSFVHRVSLLGRQIPIWGVVAACGSRLQEAFARGSRLQESFALGESGGRRLHFRVMTPPRARRHEIGRAACVPLPGEDRSVHAKAAGGHFSLFGS